MSGFEFNEASLSRIQQIWCLQPLKLASLSWLLSEYLTRSYCARFQLPDSNPTVPIELDDISLTPFDCDSPISCPFVDSLCGWKPETLNRNLLWSIGRGRVYDASKLSASLPLFFVQDGLYTDFTSIRNSNVNSMELLSEFVDAPPGKGACALFTFRVVQISLATDSFQLTKLDVSGKWNCRIVQLSNFPYSRKSNHSVDFQ